jgi:hypothetical protein
MSNCNNKMRLIFNHQVEDNRIFLTNNNNKKYKKELLKKLGIAVLCPLAASVFLVSEKDM